MVTYGTNPGMGFPITERIPDPATMADANQRASLEHALEYMALTPGEPILGKPIDVVFVGSCTNSRISDLREAARMLRGRHVADGVRMMVVPGSTEVKRQAEAEGLSTVFTDAGAEWREAGCSMCIAMNGDQLSPGQYSVSTSNRNFEGRQGKGGRTFLASPLTAVASAVTGRAVGSEGAAVSAVREPFRAVTIGGRAAAAQRHRHRPDHPGALPEDDQPSRPRRAAVPRLALSRRWLAEPRLRHQPTRDGRARSVLVVGDNFGCGSSREHAPWALGAWGIRAVISSSFADIFRNNALKNGLLPIAVSPEELEHIVAIVRDDPDAEVTVDLEAQEVRLPDGGGIGFTVDSFARRMILDGTDELGYLLAQEPALEAYERAHPARVSTLA